MSISGVNGQLLEVTVLSGKKLKDTEWISRQDPYVCLEYGTQKFRTTTCTDGGKNPTFHEKFTIPLIEGLKEFTLKVWNSNTITHDDFIGAGKVQLNKVLLEGYDDSPWPLQTKSGRHAGEVHLIMHYAGDKAIDLEKAVMMRALTRVDCFDNRPHKILLSAREELLTLPSVGAEDFLQQVEESLQAGIQHVVENPVVVSQSVGLSDRRQSKGKEAAPVIKKFKQ